MMRRIVGDLYLNEARRDMSAALISAARTVGARRERGNARNGTHR